MLLRRYSYFDSCSAHVSINWWQISTPKKKKKMQGYHAKWINKASPQFLFGNFGILTSSEIKQNTLVIILFILHFKSAIGLLIVGIKCYSTEETHFDVVLSLLNVKLSLLKGADFDFFFLPSWRKLQEEKTVHTVCIWAINVGCELTCSIHLQNIKASEHPFC